MLQSGLNNTGMAIFSYEKKLYEILDPTSSVYYCLCFFVCFILPSNRKKIWLFQFTCNRHCSSLTSTLPRLRRDTSVIITKRMVIGNDNQMDISAWMHCHYIVMDRMSDRHINISIN